MKKFKIAIGAVLALAAVASTGCSKGADTADVAAVVKNDSTVGGTRYVNMVRIYTNYTLAQEIMAERQRVMSEYQTQGQNREAELSRMAKNIQQKVANNVYLSQSSAQADERDFYNKQQQAQQWAAQREHQIATLMASQDTRLNDSIRSAIRDLCIAHHLDAVLVDTVAYYVNPALDITDAVIATLNQRYKPATPAKAATPATKK